jgi:hypothetical protein
VAPRSTAGPGWRQQASTQEGGTSADGRDRGAGDGSLGRHSTPLQAVGLAMGQHATRP